MNRPTPTVRPLSLLVASALALSACASSGALPESEAQLAPIPESIRAELTAMAVEDQRLEHLVMDQDPAIREPGFFEAKDAAQDRHADRCREIFEAHGWPSPARVGDEVASDFWVLVQHADRHPEFQAQVLAAMKGDEASGIEPSEQAMLTDRVLVNTGRKQLYGTQVAYDHAAARPYPKPLESPETVDERRAAVGLEPLWEYMNMIAQLYFRMNESRLAGEDITAPFAYEKGFTGW